MNQQPKWLLADAPPIFGCFFWDVQLQWVVEDSRCCFFKWGWVFQAPKHDIFHPVPNMTRKAEDGSTFRNPLIWSLGKCSVIIQSQMTILMMSFRDLCCLHRYKLESCYDLVTPVDLSTLDLDQGERLRGRTDMELQLHIGKGHLQTGNAVFFLRRPWSTWHFRAVHEWQVRIDSDLSCKSQWWVDTWYHSQKPEVCGRKLGPNGGRNGEMAPSQGIPKSIVAKNSQVGDLWFGIISFSSFQQP